MAVTSAVSRRRMLKKSASLAAAGALLHRTGISAQTLTTAGQTNNMAGRKFRAWVHTTPNPNKGSLQELTMLPIGGRQIVIRNEATQCCYSNTGRVLGTGNTQGGFGGAKAGQSIIFGHGGVGIVEAVGPAVKRVQVGDRVIVGVTPECGECRNCLRGRADMCLTLFGNPNDPILAVARTATGAEVVQDTNIGGHAELIITLDEWVAPIDSKAPAVELAMLHCVGGTGLGTTMTRAPIESGSDVVVFGCGPLGLSAVQGARIMGANQIIAVEPIRYRREVALKVGATVALDPNAEGDGLLEKIRALCSGTNDRKFFGGRARAGNQRGPDFIIEAVGATRFTPTVEAPPDPTGVLPLQQAWQLCPAAGTIVTTGVGQTGNVTFPAGQWANSSKTHIPSQFGGTHLKRDMPRYARLLEKGLYDAKSLATATYRLEQTQEAHQAVADRSTVAAIIVFG